MTQGRHERAVPLDLEVIITGKRSGRPDAGCTPTHRTEPFHAGFHVVQQFLKRRECQECFEAF